MRLKWAFALTVFLAIVSLPVANASLSPISYGFPTMIQSAQNTAFNQGTMTAYDLDSMNFSPWGTGSFGFGSPVISQSSIQGQAGTQVDFSQSTVFSAYSYPSVNTGLGFGGFNMGSFGSLL